MFGHPADEWASRLLEAAHTEVSTMLWLHTRLTNEQLRAEWADMLKTLEKSYAALTGLSYDLHNLLDRKVDVLEYRDNIGSLITHLNEEKMEEKIKT